MSDQARPSSKAYQLNPGDLIEDKYRVSGLLAEGGMGKIYHAVQEPLGRDVAVKIMRAFSDDPVEHERGLKRFFREASLLSRLNHPNTLTVFDYGALSNGEGFFLVMELLKGQSLREVLTQKQRLAPEVALHISAQIAASLADAHEAGVIHRDLKPPNVMLVRRGQDPYFVKLVDFGLVKSLDSQEDDDELTAVNTVVGSPRYMAPERFLVKNCDTPALDIYALGIVLYEMLAGRTPFVKGKDSTVHELMVQHIQRMPPPLSEVAPDVSIPSQLERLLMRCLFKDPKDRHESMSALLAGLKGISFKQSALERLSSERLEEAESEGQRVLDLNRERGDSTSQRTINPGELELNSAPLPRAVSAPVGGRRDARGPLRMLLVALVLLGLGGAGYGWWASQEAPDVKLTIRSEPLGALVFERGVVIGQTPLEITRALPLDLRFTLEGYEDADEAVSGAGEPTRFVYAKLKAKATPADAAQAQVKPSDSGAPIKAKPLAVKGEAKPKRVKSGKRKSRKPKTPPKKTTKTIKPGFDIKMDR